MRHAFISAISFVAVILSVVECRASVITVLPGDANWSSSGNTNGGSSVIAPSALLDGNGAVQITGDRTRFNITTGNYGTLGAVSAFSFQWAVTQQGNINSAQAPALRLFTSDATMRPLQFIWEDGEQSSPVFVNGAGSLGTAYTGDFFGLANRVYPFTSGLGRGLFDGGGVLIPGTDSAQAIGSLIASGNLGNAIVFSYGVGIGSSAGNFTGVADRVMIGNSVTSTTYDFQIASAPIPEPASMAVFGALGLTALGYRVRRKTSA